MAMTATQGLHECATSNCANILKQCALCNYRKPLTDFHRTYNAKSQHNSYCKTCVQVKFFIQRSPFMEAKHNCERENCATETQLCPKCRYIYTRSEGFVLDKRQNHRGGHAITCRDCVRYCQKRSDMLPKSLAWRKTNVVKHSEHDCNVFGCHDVIKPCKFCVAEHPESFFIQQPEKSDVHSYAYCRTRYYHNYARLKGKQCTLTYEVVYALSLMPCYCCNTVKGWNGKYNYIGLKSNSGDYTPDNVVPLCKSCLNKGGGMRDRKFMRMERVHA